MEQELIDYKRALHRIGGDNDFLFELLNDLVGQVDENLVGLQQAITKSDYDNLSALSHSLKGVSANLNVDRLSSYFFKLEKLSNNKKTEGAAELLHLITKEIRELQKFITNFN